MDGAVWTEIARQLPYVAAVILLILLLRKYEVEERRVNCSNWQTFLEERDERWQEFLVGMQKTSDVVHSSLVNELVAVSKQMQVVTAQLQAVQVTVEKFATIQECNTTEMREFIRSHSPKDKPQ